MNKKALILRIEKVSSKDGKGLRTVVFFKGCPLQCAWCSTPESQLPLNEIYYQKESCILCGRCVAACPEHALSISNNDAEIIRDEKKCNNCLICAQVCPTRSFKVYGKEMTVEEVMKQIHKDEIFFYHSGGGVTLSGGDVLCQAEFARDLLSACKDSVINTSAELDMYGEYNRIKMLLPYLDSFYVDIKIMDPEMHKKWTGVDNRTILENIKRASADCNQNALHVRVPLIWDINDSRKNVLETAEFCRGLANCAELEFLPYHRLGLNTYRLLNREYKLDSLPAMDFDDAWQRVSFLCQSDWSFSIKISGQDINR